MISITTSGRVTAREEAGLAKRNANVGTSANGYKPAANKFSLGIRERFPASRAVRFSLNLPLGAGGEASFKMERDEVMSVSRGWIVCDGRGRPGRVASSWPEALG